MTEKTTDQKKFEEVQMDYARTCAHAGQLQYTILQTRLELKETNQKIKALNKKAKAMMDKQKAADDAKAKAKEHLKVVPQTEGPTAA